MRLNLFTVSHIISQIHFTHFTNLPCESPVSLKGSKRTRHSGHGGVPTNVGKLRKSFPPVPAVPAMQCQPMTVARRGVLSECVAFAFAYLYITLYYIILRCFGYLFPFLSACLFKSSEFPFVRPSVPRLRSRHCTVAQSRSHHSHGTHT